MKGPRESFPEFNHLQRVIEGLSRYARVETPATVRREGLSYPLHTITLGSRAPDAPVLFLIGGVHGLERIGSQVVLSYLEHLLERIAWDEGLHWQLERMKIAVMPIVNPIGIKRVTRSNGNGVDLMRNAPIEADSATFLVGGHRISSLLPWYRGSAEQMEVESTVLCDFIRKECFQASHSVAVDVHSGFGTLDRLWFPYAARKTPFPNLAEVGGLKNLLDRVLPNHIYRFEPQAIHYTTHGDIWDYLYDEFKKQRGADVENGSAVFIPLTLELGSWAWVRKNPFQVFSLLGHYNPVKPHRHKRALRRHIPLFDFLTRSVVSPSRWKVGAGIQREIYHEQAMALWYRKGLQRLLTAPIGTGK